MNLIIFKYTFSMSQSTSALSFENQVFIQPDLSSTILNIVYKLLILLLYLHFLLLIVIHSQLVVFIGLEVVLNDKLGRFLNTNIATISH